MTVRSADTDKRATRRADNIALIELTSGIYGVFSGVWLGLFTQELAASCTPPSILAGLGPSLLGFIRPAAIVGFTILVSIYTFYLVKWLWIMKESSSGGRIQPAFRRLGKGAPIGIASMLGAGLLTAMCHLQFIWFWMGMWATIAWLILVALVLLKPKGDWK